ncbi:chondroitinase-B domain-containing protein [Flavobacterium faecale]|uniref:chondroitinase-B domain-containing protein n=1 Tax=Flavobacterium faecale TaxID=1355330 RepID=UPI003AAB5DD6
MKKTTFLKGKTMKHFLVLVVLFLFNVVEAQTLYTSASALQTAVNASAATGGTFIIKDGSYSGFKVTITSVTATSDKPIVIKPQSLGGVTFTGDSYFTFKKSANIILEGFNFNCSGNSTIVKLEGSNNIRVTRNIFKLTTLNPIKWVFIGGVWDDVEPYQFLSHHNRIDHNVFKDKNTPGHYITVDGTGEKVQSQYDRIDHNHFKDNSPRAVNEQESIRVGWSKMSKSIGFTTVEYNLFENCDGDPEIVSVKSSDNIIRHNTFRGSYGTLSFRHGNRNRSEGNYFFGNGRSISTSPDGATLYTGGMRVYGTDHVIINNYFEGLNGTKWDAPITLTQGDAIEGSSSDLTKHYRIERLVVAYNTLVNNDQGIEIGFSNNGAYGQKMKEVTIANNLITSDRNSLVKIVDGKDQGSDITWINNLMYPTGSATLISGATTTTLSSTSQVINENPNLIFNTGTGTWKSTVLTPLYANGATLTNDEDIDGQSRPSSSNPGADHFSMESVRYMPMTAATVGPLAYEDIPLALSPITSFAIGGESKTTNVTTNLSWTASVDSPSWLSINNSSGTGNGSISITATANTSGVARTGLLTVTGNGIDPVTLTVTQVGPTLTLSAISNFVATGESKATTVTSNVSWTASIDNPSWLSINSASGTNDGSITVTATTNPSTTARTGTLTVTGSGMSPTTLTITQAGQQSGAILINSGTNGNPVSATATSEQVGGSNFNYAINSLDKDTATRWSDNADGGIITYDFGSVYTMESIKIATTGSASKWYFYDVQFSTDGVNYSAATSIQSAAAGATTFATFPFTNVARYVKITGKGNNTSSFSTISEIEFYGTVNLSVKKNALNNAFTVYPNPASGSISMYTAIATNAVNALVYSMDGKQVLDKQLQNSDVNFYNLDISTLKNGTYLLKIQNDKNATVGTKMIIVRN